MGIPSEDESLLCSRTTTTSSRCRRHYTVLGPLLVLVFVSFFSKAVKCSVLMRPPSMTPFLDEGLVPFLVSWEAVSLLALLAVSALVGVGSWKRGGCFRIAALSLMWVSFVGAGEAYRLTGASAASFPINVASAVRADLAGTLFCFLVLSTAVEAVYRRPIGSAALEGVACLGIAILSMLVILEMIYFVRTGCHGDAGLLKYLARNAKDAKYVLSYELAPIKALLVVLGFGLILCGPSVFWILRPKGSFRSSSAALASVLALVAVGILPGRSIGHSDLTMNTCLAFFQDRLAPQRSKRGSQSSAEQEATRLPFSLVVSDKTRPDKNAVMIILESHRALSRLPTGTTPFLEDIRSRSLNVPSMYAVIPHTNKALAPLLFGLEPCLSQDQSTSPIGQALPALLRQKGYESAFFTSATLDFEDKGEILKNMGFDTVFGFEHVDPQSAPRLNYYGCEDNAIVEPALTWAQQVSESGTPFFLVMLGVTAHHPYSTPPGLQPKPGFGKGSYGKYLAALSYTDGVTQAIFEQLRNRGLAESTLVVIVGDHGEAFGEHSRRYHSSVIWDEALQVPCMISSPSIEESMEASGQRSQLDIFPTIVEMLGFRIEGGTVPGVSLLHDVPAERILFHSSWIENQSIAMRRGRFKLIFHFDRRPIEMYDTQQDPFETMNLAPTWTETHRDTELDTLRQWRLENQTRCSITSTK